MRGLIPTDCIEGPWKCGIYTADGNAVTEVRELTGANISLSCNCDNDSVSESWRFRDMQLTNESNATITRLSGATSGTYICYSANMTNNATVLVRAISKLH